MITVSAITLNRNSFEAYSNVSESIITLFFVEYLNDIKSSNYKPNSKEALIEWGDGTKVRVSIDKVEGEVVYGSVDPEYLKKLHTLNNEEIYFNIDKISLIR